MSLAATPGEPRVASADRRVRFTWRVGLALVALATAAVWHVSLLWLYAETPGVLGALLLTVFLLVVALRQLARRIRPPDRGLLMRHVARLDRVGLAFLAFLLALILLFHVGFERASSDGRSYFIQVRSLVMDWDLDFTNDEEAFGGHGARQYAFGGPLLWSPFFIATHVWLTGVDALGRDLRLDGYYYPYQRAIGLATLLYGFVGLILVYRVLRAYFAREVAALSTLGVCATTFLVWYLTVDSSFVHGVSMFATTLFLFLWHRFRSAPIRAHWAWLGISAGVMTMVRWQNGVFVILPVADLLWTTWGTSGVTWRSRLLEAARNLATFGGAAVLTFSPQLVFWQAVYGDWRHVPAGEHAFEPSLIPPFIVDVLFSSNRGLLTWTPVVWAALIGLVCFGWQQRRVAVVLAGGVLGQLWVNSAVEIWWGGMGFGARRFDNSILAFAVGLAALLTTFQRRPLMAPVIGLCALVVFNAAFMLGYRKGTLAPEEGLAFNSVMESFYERLGNPFSFPAGAYIAWRYDVPVTLYDRQRGRTYNNLTVDVGGPDDDRFLGHGWSGREQALGLSFRWADALTSTMLVPLKTNVDDYILEVEWGPFTGPGLPPQVVEIHVNGRDVSKVTLQPGLQVSRVHIARSALHAHYNQLRFRYAYAVSPNELGLSEDRRTLAVHVATIQLLRQVVD